jgi:hypothetical protein
MRLVSIFIASVVLCGCASSPVPTDKTAAVPMSRIYDGRFNSPVSDGSGRVIIKRDSGYFGVNCANFLSVDGIKVAQIEPAERLELFLSPEEHVIAVSRARACGGEIRELSVTPDATAPKTFRVWVGPNGLLEFQRTAL